jgi:hypothetical protein
VAIDHAVSPDGTGFEVVAQTVFEAGRGDWKDHQVRSPSVLQRDGRLEMWFAGVARRPHFATGIGLARQKRAGEPALASSHGEAADKGATSPPSR